jgi:hypothetical protein
VNTYHDAGAISIDRKNLVKEGGAIYVFVAVDGKAQKRKVDLRDNGGLEVQVLNGLTEGDKLIVEGQIHLSDGAKIRVVGGSQANETEDTEHGA